MLLKKLTIPLTDLRKVGDINSLSQFMVSDEKLDDDTRILYKETDESVRRKYPSSEMEVKKESDDDDDEEEEYEVKKVKVVKKVVKILSSDSEKDDNKREDSSSEKKVRVIKRTIKSRHRFRQDTDSEEEDNSDDDSDFDWEEEEEKKKKNNKNEIEQYIIPKMKSKQKLSAYEKMIEKNRAERMAFLQSLKIEEAKAGLSEIVGIAQKKKPQPVKRKFKPKENTLPVRKSRRLANLNIDLSEQSLYSNAVTAALQEIREKVIPPEMSFKEALTDPDLYESYTVDVNILEPKSESKLFSYDKSCLNKMAVSESNIAKLTPTRITALTWYPSPEQLVVAAGNKSGYLGVWNVDSESEPYLFKTHSEGITNLEFSPFNHVQLVSSSYDGILRCGDMVHHSFSEIYNISDETCCTYFDFLSATTYLVAQKNGQVALVDKRTEGKSCEKKHTCHDYLIKTVNIHPVNRNFFLTAENKGSIRLWDLRKLQRNPVADITHHKRCVQSAYFSPITGNSILATSADNSISIFDSTNLTADIKMKQQMKHNNETGRWLSVFRAKWLPNSDEAFVVGSMEFPRRIEVFDKNMFIYNIMMHENLTTITSTNAFHPMRPALAGANSSGKVFVFL